jgi:tRNA(adenine34) deaminase
MSQALAQAKIGATQGEVPVGAVFYHENQVIASAHNLVETNNDASAHAEVLVIREAAQKLGNWRLESGVLCVTLEPCTMCLGLIRLSRIKNVIFGASDPRLGAMGSLYDLSLDPRLGIPPRVVRGVAEQECVKVLRDFFELRRKEE